MLADIRMIERGCSARFTLKPFRKVLVRDFDSNGAAQPRVPRAVHLAHASRAQRRENFVRTEAGSGFERHWWRVESITLKMTGKRRAMLSWTMRSSHGTIYRLTFNVKQYRLPL